jgi:hypothetical protein
MNEQPPPRRPSTGQVLANEMGCVLLFLIACATLVILVMTLAGVFNK